MPGTEFELVLKATLWYLGSDASSATKSATVVNNKDKFNAYNATSFAYSDSFGMCICHLCTYTSIVPKKWSSGCANCTISQAEIL